MLSLTSSKVVLSRGVVVNPLINAYYVTLAIHLSHDSFRIIIVRIKQWGGMSLSAMGTFEMRKMTISLTNLLLRIVWNSLIHIKLQSPSNTHSVVTEDTLWKHSSSRWSRLLKLRSLFQREHVNECSSPYCRIKFVDIWYTMKYIIFVSANLKIAWRIRGLV